MLSCESKISKIKSFLLILICCILFIVSGCSGGGAKQEISGQIKFAGTALSGVTVTLSGPSTRTTMTDANGNYSFADVEPGTYTITPSLVNYTFTPSNRPVYISGMDAIGFNFNALLPNWISTSTHTLFIKTDGTVVAWGNNVFGQLGDGTKNNSNTAVPVSFPPDPTTTVIAVAAGSDFSIALKSDGTVWAWGHNNKGQLGLGVDNITDQPTPVPISTLSNIKAITAGCAHAAAVDTSGHVFVWGGNENGQLGDGTTNTDPNPVPKQLTGFTTAVSVSAGFDHTMALLSTGQVWTWGNNDKGQLGNGTTTQSTSPIQITVNGAQISAGYKFSVALRYTGSNFAGVVTTWGLNDKGQLGEGTATPYKTTLVELGTFLNIASVAAGYDHAVALKSDGTVWAWGNNDKKQLGIDNTSTTYSNIPLQSGSGTVQNIARIAAGTGNTVTIRSDNTIWLWGNDTLPPVQFPY